MAIPSWRAKEERRLRTARHIGGPGEPDCREGAAIVEVKHLQHPVDKSVMDEVIAKPRAPGARPLIIVSTSGFTAGARELANETLVLRDEHRSPAAPSSG